MAEGVRYDRSRHLVWLMFAVLFAVAVWALLKSCNEDTAPGTTRPDQRTAPAAPITSTGEGR